MTPIFYERLVTKVIGMAVSNPVGSKDFTTLENIQNGSGLYPVSYQTGIGHLLGIKQPGCKINH
jgi:hypothetical protein